MRIEKVSIIIIIIISNSNWSNFKIGQAQSARPIWNYEHDYSLNCTTRGPITNLLIISITNFGIKNVF